MDLSRKLWQGLAFLCHCHQVDEWQQLLSVFFRREQRFVEHLLEGTPVHHSDFLIFQPVTDGVGVGSNKLHLFVCAQILSPGVDVNTRLPRGTLCIRPAGAGDGVFHGAIDSLLISDGGHVAAGDRYVLLPFPDKDACITADGIQSRDAA